jgi:hypothetical protein
MAFALTEGSLEYYVNFAIVSDDFAQYGYGRAQAYVSAIC